MGPLNDQMKQREIEQQGNNNMIMILCVYVSLMNPRNH